MKKLTVLTFIVLLLVSLFTLQASASAELPRVVDDAGLLSDAEEASLEALIADVAAKYSFDVVIVTTNDSEGKSAMAFADDYYDYKGYGYGENNDGVILAVCMDQRNVWISGTGYGIDVFDSASIDETLDLIWNDFTAERYYEAFADFVGQAEKLYDVTKNGLRDLVLLALLAVGLLTSIIVPNVWKSAHKSAVVKQEAGDYAVRDSLTLTVATDDYLRSSVARVKIETQSKSSGGGTHTSSSGTSHSGGGRSF